MPAQPGIQSLENGIAACAGMTTNPGFIVKRNFSLSRRSLQMNDRFQVHSGNYCSDTQVKILPALQLHTRDRNIAVCGRLEW
jgi:hypothetical protein